MAAQEIGVEIALVHQAQEGALGIEVGGHRAGFDLLAAFQHHAASAAARAPAPWPPAALVRISAPRGARGGGDGLRHRAHAAAHEAPQPAVAAHAAHAMVQQDVGRAGRARAAVGADHAIGGQRDLHLLRIRTTRPGIRRRSG